MRRKSVLVLEPPEFPLDGLRFMLIL